MKTIYMLDAEDTALLDYYCEVDRGSGEAFADFNCTVLVDNWREIAEAEIRRCRLWGNHE